MLFFQIFRLTCKTLCLATGLDPKSGKLGTPPGRLCGVSVCLLFLAVKLQKCFYIAKNNGNDIHVD